MKNVYLVNRGKQIKLAHPAIFNYKPNLEEVYHNKIEKGTYLSPEEMQAFYRGEEQLDNSHYDSNVYRLGIIILALMNMRHMNHLFDYNSCQINEKALEEILRNSKNTYSERLVNIVAGTLKKSDRLSLRNLHRKLEERETLSKNIDVTLINEQG